MNFTYTLTDDPGVVLRSDGASVPIDANNADGREYLAFQAAGKTPAPYEPPVAVPACQLWQLQAVMTAAQWTAVQNAVAALNNPAVSAFFTHGTNVIPADSKTLISLGEAIGLTAGQATALVEQASTVSIP
jgi:hypothetical protein